jgi:fibronectin-binding autotransporter adhesin
VASVDGSSAGGQSLTVNTGSGAASLGNLGATTRLGAVSDTGSATLTGGTYNANSLNLGALTLAANATLNTSAANGAVTVASADGSSAGGQSLTVNTGSGTASLGNLGAATRLGAVSDTGSATLTGGTYNANSLNLGALTLAANTTLNTSAANGAITVASVDGSSAGSQSLTVNTGSGAASLGNLGAATRLGAVSDTGSAKLTGGTYNAGSLTFGGNVTLTAATTTLNTTQSSGAAGDIIFNANILGTSDGGQNLVLIAGPGTGTAAANGNMALQNAGTGAVRLNNLTVSGNNFTALTVNIAGNYGSTLTGNQVFASDTLDAGGNVVSNVAGNATGHIASQGTVTENVGGTISGTISGSTLTLKGGTITNAALTGTNGISLSAGTLSNSSIVSPNVLIVANTTHGTTITATNLNITASGDIQGTWTNLSSNGGSGLSTNGQPSTFNNLSPQQLVVEGFSLPLGTQIGANGALILPQGLVIGLLSPGGGAPRVVLVRSVRSLGELLSEGYSAIVIDLNSRKKDEGMELAAN